MRRKTIAIDIDDVLSRSAEGFVRYSNKRWGHNLEAEDYLENWAEVWNISVENAVQRAHEIYDSGIFAEYAHFEQAVPVLARLKERYKLVIVTSRRAIIKPETDVWLDRHFPGVFAGVHYAGIWDTEHHPLHKLNLTKAAICRELGADYLVDDQVKHCVAAAQAGMEALLFGNYKWNRDGRLPEKVTRVHSWEEVARYFDA